MKGMDPTAGHEAVAYDGATTIGLHLRPDLSPLFRARRVLRYLVAWRPASPAVEALLGLVLSPDGQAVVARKLTPAR
jgi:hypothetical protein